MAVISFTVLYKPRMELKSAYCLFGMISAMLYLSSWVDDESHFDCNR